MSNRRHEKLVAKAGQNPHIQLLSCPECFSKTLHYRVGEVLRQNPFIIHHRGEMLELE